MSIRCLLVKRVYLGRWKGLEIASANCHGSWLNSKLMA
jgi:hypothetical protein